MKARGYRKKEKKSQQPMHGDDDAGKWMIPFDMQIRLKFKDSHSMIDIDLTLKVNDDVRSVVRNLVDEHHVAVHNEDRLMSTIRELIQLEIVERAAFEFACEGYEDDSDGGGDAETSGSAADEYEFPEMFHTLFFQHAHHHIHLIKIEQQMNHVYKARIADRDLEVARLREKHSVEMERACDIGKPVQMDDDESNDISSLVNDHMREMEELEAKWATAFKEMKANLAKQYDKFVTDLFHEQMDTKESIIIMDASDVDFERVRDLYPSHARVAEELQALAGTIKELDNKPMGRKLDTPPTKLDFANYSYVSSLVNYFQNDKLKKAAKQPPTVGVKVPRLESPHIPNTLCDEYFQCYVIAELGFKIYAVFTDRMAEVLCRYSQAEHLMYDQDTWNLLQRSQTKRKLYGNSPSALMLSCSPIFSDNGSELENFVWHNQEFYKLAFESEEYCAPELHFDELQVQIENIIRDYNTLDDQRMTKKSQNNTRHFITKHSNLSNIQMIYHLIPDSETFDEKSMLSGVRDVVRNCLANGVTTLSIPLPLPINSQSGSGIVQVGDTMVDQFERILKKNFVTKDVELQRERSLKNVLFFLPRNPKHSGNIYEQCQSTVLRLFKDYKVQQLVNDQV